MLGEICLKLINLKIAAILKQIGRVGPISVIANIGRMSTCMVKIKFRHNDIKFRVGV